MPHKPDRGPSETGINKLGVRNHEEQFSTLTAFNIRKTLANARWYIFTRLQYHYIVKAKYFPTSPTMTHAFRQLVIRGILKPTGRRDDKEYVAASLKYLLMA